MRIVIAGGTGFVGRALRVKLLSSGHEVIVLTRKSGAGPTGLERSVVWDGKAPGDWEASLDGAGAVINLAGENIAAKKWTAARKRTIVSSRVDATRAIVDAIRRAKEKPALLINASAVGYYGDVPDATLTDASVRGVGFLAETCEQWEAEARRAEGYGTRVILARLGPVLGENGGPPGKQDEARLSIKVSDGRRGSPPATRPSSQGGMLSRMIPPFRSFMGAPLGTGRQWIPWIHQEDVTEIFLFLLERKDFSGPVNVTSPGPVTMKFFCAALGKVLRRPCGWPVPGFLLKMVLGEMSAVILSSQKAFPAKLIQGGYRFRHPDLPEALGALLKKMA